jgi:hypothetical protein
MEKNRPRFGGLRKDAMNEVGRAIKNMEGWCRAPLQKGCPKHHGHKGDPRVTPGTCGAGGEKDQVILVWVRALGVGNTSYHRD